MSLNDSLNDYIKNGSIGSDKKSTSGQAQTKVSLDDTLNSYIKTGNVVNTPKKANTPAPTIAPVKIATPALNQAGQKAFFGNSFQTPANLPKSQAPKIAPSVKVGGYSFTPDNSTTVNTGVKNSTPLTISKEQAQGLKPLTLITDLAKGFYNQYANPSESTIQAEQMLGFTPTEKPKTGLEKVERVVSAPIRTIAKGFIRTFAPMLEPTAETFGQAIATGEISNKVASGELPVEALDTLTALNKKWYNVVGDSTQAVLAAYSPSFLKDIAKNKVLSGVISGAEIGTTFGVAQTMSLGETDPKKIAEILLKSAIAGTILGTTTGYLGHLGVKFKNNAVKKVQVLDAVTIINRFADKPITNTSSLADIKAAYYSAAKKTHPDLGGNPLEFSDVSQAYKFLTQQESKFIQKSAPSKEPVRGLLEKENKSVAKIDEAGSKSVANIKETVNTVNNEVKTAVEKQAEITPEVIDQVNTAKTNLETYVETNKTPVINYEGSAPIGGEAPRIVLDTVKYDNGTFGVNYEASFNNTNITAPFNTSAEYKTSEEAISVAKQEIKKWLEEQNPDDWQGKLAIQDVVKAIDNNTINAKAVGEPTITPENVTPKVKKVSKVEAPVNISEGDKTLIEKTRQKFSEIFDEYNKIAFTNDKLVGENFEIAVNKYAKKYNISPREKTFLLNETDHLSEGLIEAGNPRFIEQYAKKIEQLKDLEKNPNTIPPKEMEFDVVDMPDDNVLIVDKGDYVVNGDGKIVRVSSGNRVSHDFYQKGFIRVESAFGEPNSDRIGYASQLRQATAEELKQSGLDPSLAKKDEFMLDPDAESQNKALEASQKEASEAYTRFKKTNQKETVSKSIEEAPKTIKQIAEETKIKEPNVRRILGVGAKEGTFERVDKGVYKLNKNGKELAYIETGNALEVLPRLVKDGFKADMVFLDIPYNAAGNRGGNRMNEAKETLFPTITPKEFGTFLESVSEALRVKSSPLVYMFSQSKTSAKTMAEYTNEILKAGFIPLAKGNYYKMSSKGTRLTKPMRPEALDPEGILIFNKTGIYDFKTLSGALPELEYQLVRPKGWQTEKPAELLADLIKLTTNEGDVVLDPFAGSGVTGAEAIKLGRATTAIEKSEKAVEGYIKPRFAKASGEVKEGTIKLTTDFDINDPMNPLTLKAAYENELITSLQEAKAGSRIVNGTGIDKTITGVKSTFPSWIPQNLKLSAVVKPVAEHIIAGTLPTSKPQLDLYNIIKKEFDDFGKEVEAVQKEIDVAQLDFFSAKQELANVETQLNLYDNQQGSTEVASQAISPKEISQKANPQKVENKIVYRGTEKGGELKESFETDYGDGYYFADRKSTASEYGKVVDEYSVTLKNPLVIKDRYEMNTIVDNFLALKQQGKTNFERTNDYLKSQGYDGIIVKNGGLGGEDVGGFTIAFDKSQVKTKTVAPQIAKPTQAIKDFGEKIGGAKKDTWSKRGLNIADLQEMNQREIEKYLKKDNIWVKNYEELVAEGKPAPMVMYIKKVRDSLPSSVGYKYSDNTPELKAERNEQYVNFIKEVQNSVLKVKDFDDIKNFYRAFVLENGYAVEKPSSYGQNMVLEYTDKQRNNPFLVDKFRKASKLYTGFDFQQLIDDAKKEQFGVKAGEKMPKNIEVRFDGRDKTWFVARTNGRFGQIIKKGLTSEAEGVAWIKENAKDLTAKTSTKRKFIPPQLTNIHRSGIDYRQDKNVTGENFINEFGFKGGEFGNWLNEKDRQVSLNYAYDALKDLADTLGISPKNVALNNTLSIAFGARGVAGASAHYEPARKVFNLTKMNGAGSTAHEWFHALEDYLGKEGAKYQSFIDLKDTIKQKLATKEELAKVQQDATKRYERNISNTLANIVEGRQVFKDLSESQKAEYNSMKDLILSGKSELVKGDFNTFIKKNTGRNIEKDSIWRIESWSRFINTAEKGYDKLKVNTQFKNDALALSGMFKKEQGYWESEEELLARAFASYITDKTKSGSDYLSGHSESPVELVDGKTITGFPVGEERIAINKAFDNFFEDLKAREVFTPEKPNTGEKANYSIKNVSEFESTNKGIQDLDTPFDGAKLKTRLEADMKRLGLNFDVELFDKIYTGEMASKVITREGGIQTLKVIPEEAAGVAIGNKIFLSKEATRFTEKHELIHIISQNMDNIPAFSKYNKAELLKEAGQVYGKKYTDPDFEEVLARGFEDFVYGRKTFFGKLKEFFTKLLNQVKAILNFTRKTNLKSFYEDVLYSKADKVTTLTSPARRFGNQTMTAGRRTVDFGREVKSGFQVKEFNPEEYVAEKVNDAKLAREGDAGTNAVKNWLTNLTKEAKTKLVDFSAPIEDLLYKTLRKEKITLKPSEDIHNQIDRVLRAPTIAGQFMKDNGLYNVVKNVDSIDNLDQYLIAKHAIDLEGLGIETGRDVEKDALLVEAFKGKYEEMAQQVYDYSHKLLDYSVSANLISPETASYLKTLYVNYVPFNRIFSEIEKAQMGQGSLGGKAVASLSRQSVVQKIEGSERQIESPIASLLIKTNDAFKQGEKNKAARLLGSYKDLPDNPFQLEEVTPNRELRQGEQTISFLDRGNKRTFVTTPEVARAAKALDVQTLGIIGQIVAFPTRIARLGITGINLPFVAANVAKDQVSAFINSKNSLRTSIANPKVFFIALGQSIGHGKLYAEMVREGGGGTSFDISRNQAPQTINKIRANRNIGSKIKYVATHPLELVRIAEDIVGRSEEFTRLKQYAGTKEALMADKLSPEEARIAGARASREDTVNFSRSGEWGKVLNASILYINAGIQGTRTLLRSFKTNPKGTALKIALGALLPVAIITAYNLKDEKRKKVYDDIPEWEKQNNLIVVLNDNKDSAGNYTGVIKIPMSQEINNLTDLVRKEIESLHGSDSVAFGDLVGALFGTVTPFSPNLRTMISQLTPQLIKPSVEVSANTNLFTGSSIVSSFSKNLPPEEQVYPDTSGTARKIGAILNVSPLKVQFFLKETFGEVALQIENLSDKALYSLGLIPKEQIGGRGLVEGVTRRFITATSGAVDQATQLELNNLLGDKSSAVFKQKQALLPTFEKIQGLIKEGNDVEAQNIIDNLSDSEWVTYKLMRTAQKTQDSKNAKIAVFNKYNEVTDLFSTGREAEAQKILDDMTNEEYKAYQSLKTSLKFEPAPLDNADAKVSGNFTTKDEGGFISGIALYAKALGTDPVTAFNRIFTGQRITKLVNGAIIVERMPLEDSQAIKTELGGNNADWKLEHIVSLELGGSNARSNLVLVPTPVWEEFTKIDNELGLRLKNGEITKAEAQRLIKEAKKDYIK